MKRLKKTLIKPEKETEFLQDNGKAFKAKYFIENGLSSLFTNLGIQPRYAKPYNAKAKQLKDYSENCKTVVKYYCLHIRNKHY